MTEQLQKNIDLAAAQIRKAYQTRQPCSPVRELLPEKSIKAAYAVQKINAELARQITILAEIARKKGIPVIISNQVFKWDDKENMVGGDILKYWGKCLVELVNDKGRRTAYLRKHRSLPEKSSHFQIWEGGVRKRGWI